MQRIYSATSQGMARDVCVLPLQTDQHALHSAMWIVPGFAFTELCLACALTRLGDPEGWSLLRKKVLREFAALLASATHPGYAIFKEDLRVQQHLATTALDSLERCSEEEEEEEVVACSEVLLAIVALPTSKPVSADVLVRTANRCVQISETTAAKQRKMAPHLKLILSVLQQRKELVRDVARSQGKFLDVLQSTLECHQEEAVVQPAAAVVALLLQSLARDVLPVFFVDKLCACVGRLLANSKSNTLTASLLSIVQTLLEVPRCAEQLVGADQPNSERKGSTLASTFKRVLLSTDSALQVSGLECLHSLMHHCPCYRATLLREDTAELLFEAMKTKNESVLRHVQLCLIGLSEDPTFYTDCHSIFGIEAIVTSMKTMLKMRSWQSAKDGLTLVQKILESQPVGVPLYTATPPLEQLLFLLKEVLSLSDQQTLAAKGADVLRALVCPQHIPSSLPLQTLLPLLALCQHGLDLEVERELQPTPFVQAHSSSQMSCIARITHHVTGSLGVEKPHESSGQLSRQCGQLAAITANCYRFQSAADRPRPHTTLQLCKCRPLVLLPAVCVCSLSRSRGSGSGGDGGNAKCSASGFPGSTHREDEEEEVLSFALQAFESSLVPVFLLQYGPATWRQEALCTHLLQLGVDLLSALVDSPARRLAKNLVQGGFVQIALEGKKEVSSSGNQSRAQLLSVLNNFLTCLCVRVAELVDSSDANYTKEVLLSQLPNVKGSSHDMLALLKAGFSATSATHLGGKGAEGMVSSTSVTAAHLFGGRSAEVAMQQAILCVFFTDYLLGNRMAPVVELQRALTLLLASQPALAQLPATTLKHVCFLVSVCSMECPNQSTDKQGFTHLGVVNSWLKVECALVTALASLPDPAMVCLPHPTALEWIVGLCGPSVDSVKAGTVVKAWVGKVVSLLAHEERCDHFFEQGARNSLVALSLHSSTTLDSVLGLLSAPALSSHCLSVLRGALSRVAQGQHRNGPAFINSLLPALENCLSNMDFDEICLARVMGLLAELYGSGGVCWSNRGEVRAHSEPRQTGLRATHKAVGIFMRTSVEKLLQASLSMLYAVLAPQLVEGQSGSSHSTQAAIYLGSNMSFCQKLLSLIPSTSKPKDLSLLTANCLLVCSALVHHHQHHRSQQKQLKQDTLTLPTASLVAALLSTLPQVQMSALQLWSAIFTSHGRPHPFTLAPVKLGPSGCFNVKGSKQLSLPAPTVNISTCVHFQVANLVLHDVESVRSMAVLCIGHLFAYLTVVEPTLAQHLLRGPWSRLLTDCLQDWPDQAEGDLKETQRLVQLMKEAGDDRGCTLLQTAWARPQLQLLSLSNCMLLPYME